MKPVKFLATILEGHKEDAVEVPFDPGMRWGLTGRRLRPGQRGFLVGGTINGVPFEGTVVPRSRKFWLLLPDKLKSQAGIKAGEKIQVSLEPRSNGSK